MRTLAQLVLALVVGSFVTSMTGGQVVRHDALNVDIAGSIPAPSTAPRALLIPRGNPLTVITPEPISRSLDIQTPTEISEIVAAAARRHGVDVAFALRIVWCESRFDPNAVGDHGAAVGAWQFHLPTWAANARRLGIEGDFRRDPYLSSEVASWMLARGQAHQWTCAR